MHTHLNNKMLINLPHLNTNCLHILGSINASANTGVSLLPKQNQDSGKKHGDGRKNVFFDNPNGENTKPFRRVYRKPRHDTKRIDIFQNPQLAQHDLQRKSDDGTSSKHVWIEKKKKKRDDSVEGRDCLVEKTRTKCSTKWGSYGGCIPAVLEALETVKDLDVALKPWEGDLNNKERSIILKEQSNWARAFEIFQWLKKKGCYEVNVIHYNIMFRILGKARKWSLIEEMWDEMMKMGVSPINSTFSTLIDVYSKGGCKEKAMYWVDLMNKKGTEADEVTMSTVVQMYKKSSEFNEAEKYFVSWSSGMAKTNGTSNDSYPSRASINLYTYNNLIDTYGKAGNIVEASRTFKRMLSDGIVPDTVTFNTMMHICGNNGQLEEVSSLMQKMEELRCPFNTRTFNILISVHAKHDKIDIAMKYFAKMKEARLEPDLVTYRTLVHALSTRRMVSDAEKLVLEMDENGVEIDEFTQTSLTRMYIKDGKLEKSWLWFERFHSRGNMSSEWCSANIDAFGERGHVLEAERAFTLRLKENVTVLEFNVMIKAYGIGKRYDAACKLFDKMDHYGVAPDRCSYNSLIQILARADLPHKAKPYLMKFQEAGLVIDCVPYCAVISSFAKLGQLNAAEELYKEMIIHNVQPDVRVYDVLINAFAEVGTMKKAVTYVDSMKKSGLPMNPVIYNSLIKLYTKYGYLKKAQETYSLLLQSSESGPDIYSSNCMIDLYSERSMVKQAEEVFESLKKKNIANEFSFTMMVCMYKKVGMIDEAIRVAELMRELGLVTDLLSFNNVLALYAVDGRLNDAVETFKAMIKSSVVKPDDSTFDSLGALLTKCGVSKKAVEKLEIAVKTDFKGGLEAWIQTLSSVIGEDYDDF